MSVTFMLEHLIEFKIKSFRTDENAFTAIFIDCYSVFPQRRVMFCMAQLPSVRLVLYDSMRHD